MRRSWLIIGGLLALAAVFAPVLLLRNARSQRGISATLNMANGGGQLSVARALGDESDAGFAKALTPRQFSFPADHGPHPEFRTEWWYVTGNLETADGRVFGYQLTFFRTGLTPKPVQRASQWATNNVYMAHFALTDVAGKQFYARDRFSRDGAGLAGAQADPLRVWTESWQLAGDPEAGMRVEAATEQVAVKLVARSAKAPVLQGDQGLSQKSAEPGNASYYYSLTRLATDGEITVGGQTYRVTGLSWLDREWSTSALGPNQIGWDWFALHFNDGADMMYYQMRLKDGGVDPLSGGALIAQDGSKVAVRRDEAQIEVLDTWQSPRNGARYPSRWRVSMPGRQLELEIEPYLNDQELPLTVVYWEGAVKFSGTYQGRPVSGSGYIEMTGYADVTAAAR